MQLISRLDDTFQCYSNGNDDAYAAILIIHDWWGVKPYNLEWATRLAQLGYRAVVIDLYDGAQPQDTEEAGAKMRSINQARADAKLEAALHSLSQQHRRLAVLGWSFGGLQAQRATWLMPDTVAATVFFYCRVMSEADEVARLHGAVLGLFSETERTWPEKQEKWVAAMTAAGKTHEYASFQADHGFVNPQSPRYDPEASEASWKRVVDFLSRTL